MKSSPTAESLKSSLWTTLQGTLSKKITPHVANSVAAQAREIMRIVSAEIAVNKLNQVKPTRLAREFFTADAPSRTSTK